MKLKPSLFLMMALASGVTGVAHGVSAVQGNKPGQALASNQETRLGTSLKQDIAKRDRADSKRARELEMREQVVRAAQQRLESSVEEQKKGQKNKPKGSSDESDEFDQLARIYQSMNPKKAAVVFQELSIDVQLKVARRMRERQTAEIMSSMTPQAAARLSMALAGGASVPRVQRAKPTQAQP